MLERPRAPGLPNNTPEQEAEALTGKEWVRCLAQFRASDPTEEGSVV